MATKTSSIKNVKSSVATKSASAPKARGAAAMGASSVAVKRTPIKSSSTAAVLRPTGDKSSGIKKAASASDSLRSKRQPKSSSTGAASGSTVQKTMNTTKNKSAATAKNRNGQSTVISTNSNGVVQSRTDLDIEYYRGLLLLEQARLEAERDQMRNRGGEMDGAMPEEADSEEDTADMASAMMDKEFDLSVEEEIEKLLASVDHALQKMDEGTYGVCDMSGEPIPRGRLELIPWASLTVECQALSEGE